MQNAKGNGGEFRGSITEQIRSTTEQVRENSRLIRDVRDDVLLMKAEMRYNARIVGGVAGLIGALAVAVFKWVFMQT
jgi:hypothetical protein